MFMQNVLFEINFERKIQSRIHSHFSFSNIFDSSQIVIHDFGIWIKHQPEHTKRREEVRRRRLCKITQVQTRYPLMVKSRCKQLFKRIQSSSPSETLDSLSSLLMFLEELFCAEVLKLETYSNKRERNI